MTRLLAVSWSMPPLLFPRSVQVSRALKVLTQRGWQTTVVCGEPAAALPGTALDTELEKVCAGYYEVVRVSPTPGPHDALLARWLVPAVSAVQSLLSERKFDAMITFAQPWVDHLVGLDVRKRFDVPWVAHFSDPWVDNPYYAGAGKDEMSQWRRMEYEVIRGADAAIFTNRWALDLVMAKYPARWRAKASVVPHGYDTDSIAAVERVKLSHPGVRMVYTGDLYGKRTPVGLLHGLAELAQRRPLRGELEVAFIGRCSDEYRHMVDTLGLAGVVQFRRQLPYVESLRVAAAADVLLVIDAPSARPSLFLPSKLVDYLMFRKPLLGLTPCEGAAADLLLRLGCPVVPPDDVTAIAEAVSDILVQSQRGPLEVPAVFDSVAAEYDIRRTAQRLDDMLSAAMSRSLVRPETAGKG